MTSTEIITREILQSVLFIKGKEYAVFNNSEFYIVSNNALIGLNIQNLDISKTEIFNNLNDNGSHFVAEFSSIDELLDFYNSNTWRTV